MCGSNRVEVEHSSLAEYLPVDRPASSDAQPPGSGNMSRSFCGGDSEAKAECLWVSTYAFVFCMFLAEYFSDMRCGQYPQASRGISRKAPTFGIRTCLVPATPG